MKKEIREKILAIFLTLAIVVSLFLAMTVAVNAEDPENNAPIIGPLTVINYTDTADDKSFEIIDGTISVSDSEYGDTITYGIDGGTTGGDDGVNGIMYDVSLTKTYGTLYVNSASGNYAYVPNNAAMNALRSGNQSETFTVTATDNGGLSGSGTLTVNVTGANDKPYGIVPSTYSITENVAPNTTAATLATSDRDDGDTFTYTLVSSIGSVDNSSFTISGNNLIILISPDYETKTSYSIRIRTTDQGGESYEQFFLFYVSNVNEPPTNISLSSNEIDENMPANSTVGTLSTSDPDDGNTFTYTLTAGSGDNDNGSFNISGNSLRLTNPADYETKSSYSVRIKVTDAGGLAFEKDFTITVNNVNEAPVITSPAAASFAENGTGVVYMASATDPEGNAISWSISGTDAALFNIDSATGEIAFVVPPNFEAPGDSNQDNVYHITLTAADNGTGSLTASQNLAITVTDINEAPVITTGSTVSVTEGRTSAFTAAADDPEGNDITWSITGGDDASLFSIVAGTGVITFTSAPSFNTPADADLDNQYVLEITASDGTFSIAKTITVIVTRQVSDPSPSTPSPSDPSPSTPPSKDAAIEVNGEPQSAGQITTQTTGGSTVTTIAVDDEKLNSILANTGNHATVTLQTSTASDAVIGELSGQTIKNMENKEAILEIRTGMVTYTLPASQINIAAVSDKLGQQAELKDVKVSVKISAPSEETVRIIEDTAQTGNYALVVKPVEFEITCTVGDKTVEISQFNGYVERMIAIPDGIDPSRVTTGVVLNSDGTFYHVPTEIIAVDGRYYARIKSLTNSVYSVIGNPVAFSDLTGYDQTGDIINDMGSRLIIMGVGGSKFEPEREITRAELSAIIVRALGLKPTAGISAFSDVAVDDWYAPYIQTAYDYGIISGYGNGRFGPNDKITREQAMKMLGNAMKITGLDTSFGSDEINKILSAYTDSGEIVSWGRQNMAACIKAGIISGRGGHAAFAEGQHHKGRSGHHRQEFTGQVGLNLSKTAYKSFL